MERIKANGGRGAGARRAARGGSHDFAEVEHPLPREGREAQVRREVVRLLAAEVRQARVGDVVMRASVS